MTVPAAEGAAEDALGRLASSEDPFVIGVRHHSPACAAAIPALLDAFAPARLMIELPAEMEPWLKWLGDPTLEAPVALSGATRSATGDDGGLFFYPFADFSPELAAIRWACARGVPIEAFDLPAGAREPRERASRGGELIGHLFAAYDVDDVESLWDRMVEARARRAEPEATRRAALLFGYALRADEAMHGGPDPLDLRREAYMRARLAKSRDRTAAVVGAFHGGALLETPIPVPVPAHDEPAPREIVTSLIGYGFELLDSRSGYPAGIRDPLWQQRMFELLRDDGDVRTLVAECAVSIARSVRGRGHVASLPDATEAARLAHDVATLRGLPAPGRRELLEAIESTMGQGERLGRGRVLARALEDVLVGRARGRVPDGTPRTGLFPHVVDHLKALSLPGPPGGLEPREMDLDPLRSELDRDRDVTFERLRAAGVVYAEEEPRSAELLTKRWQVTWTPATEATLEMAGLLGVTVEQAARGAILRKNQRAKGEDRWTVAERLVSLHVAASCALGDLVATQLVELVSESLSEAGLAEVIALLAFLDRLVRGQFAGLDRFVVPPEVRVDDVLAVAVRAVEGMSGSTRLEDAQALVEVVSLATREEIGGRLGWALDRLAAEGSPLMQGAGGAARVLVSRDTPDAFATTLGSFIDQGGEPLGERLRGALVLATPLFEAHPDFLAALLARIEQTSDDDFLVRLPSLRRGFAVLSPAARQRLLDVIAEQLGEAVDLELATAPEVASRGARADREGAAAIDALGIVLPEPPPFMTSTPTRVSRGRAGDALGLHDRARLILGREREKLPMHAMRTARALDELYGHGRGEGARRVGGGGREDPFPTVREWSEELEALFGTEIREEVLGRAAAEGRPAAALALDPETVTPSVELLERVLSLRGGLAERDVSRLRRLVQRIVDALVEALAQRVRSALTGLVTPRPSSRPIGPLDLRRTVAANLRTARRSEDGSVGIVAERLSFKSRSKRSLDWHLVLVVDVSGSMEASVIYSAMMAAILNALPALTVRFVAFNTQVLDLSERVDDPLALLLEIAVGGGTDIGRGLRYARSLLKVPQRSMVVIVSDFEEGVSTAGLVSEARALVESGAKVLGLAALDDRGAPRYHRGIAELVASTGVAIAALTPLELARWVAEQIR